MPTPEALARRRIDALLAAAGWAVRDIEATSSCAARGMAIREFVLAAAAALLKSQLHHQRLVKRRL